MNKKALFLSVAIATFILACLGGVYSVYKALASSSAPLATVQTVSQVATTTSAPMAVGSRRVRGPGTRKSRMLVEESHVLPA